MYFFEEISGSRALWRSDGTPAGTVQVFSGRDPRGQSIDGPGSLVACERGLVFLGKDDTHGLEPWISDGTPFGTQLLLDILPGRESSDALRLVSDGRNAWFPARTSATGTEWWITDGSAAGTHLVSDVMPGPASGAPSYSADRILANGARTVFAAYTDTSGWEPWSSDGTPAGTRMIANVQPDESDSDARALVNLQGRLGFFAGGGYDPFYGTGIPWLSDGSEAGTMEIGNLGRPSGLAFIALHGSRALMQVADASGWPYEPWVADLATRTLAPAAPSVNGPWQLDAAAHSLPGGWLVGLDDGISGFEPGTWDGTSLRAGVELAPGPNPAAMSILGTANGEAIAAAKTDTGFTLHATDGTPAGTRLVASLNGAGPPWWAAEIGDLLLFGFEMGSDGGLWVTDGSAAGTRRLTTHVPAWGLDDDHRPPPQWRLDAPILAGDRLVLPLLDPDSLSPEGFDIEAWITDGSAAGTFRLAELFPGPSLRPPGTFAAAGTSVVFAARTDADGDELFVTDGTPAGTRLLVDLVPGPAGSNPRDLATIAPGGPVVFSAYTPDRGREPWITDGTPAGTLPLPEIVPGIDSSSPSRFVAAGLHVFFIARGGAEGRELWAFDLASAPEDRNCLDAVDDDGDLLIDCEDLDCAGSEACPETLDTDGDGVSDADDCAPMLAGVQLMPLEVAELRVKKVGVTLRLSWLDPAGQPPVTYEVAGGILASLRQGDSGACLAGALAGPTWDDPAPPAQAWYLVRAVNACSAIGEGWGPGSIVRPLGACP